jgi:16S rRNA processing protein RimM
MADAKHIVLAIVGAPHGVKGEVRVKAFTAEPTAIASYGPLFSDDGRRFEIERLRPAKGVVVAKFRGIDDRDAAERLKGISLSVARNALPAPEPDEFYHADLIGLAAVDRTGKPLGEVVAIENYGAGDFLEIAPPGARKGSAALLLPFTKECVPDIDIAGGRLVVVPPQEIEAKAEASEEKE